MKIPNIGVPTTSTPLTPQQRIQETETAPTGTAASSLPASVPDYAPSPELLNLVNQLRQQPDVREDRVQAAAQRLQQGYYNTSASVEQTADAILQSGD